MADHGTLSAIDAIIYNSFVIGGASARVVADEIRKPTQYVYFRSGILQRRFGVERTGRAEGPIRSRNDGKHVAKRPPRLGVQGKSIDWDLVMELNDGGASAGEIGAVFRASESTIRRGISDRLARARR